MAFLLLIWLGAALCLIWLLGQRRGSAGLPMAYFLGLALIHVPGSLAYLDVDGSSWAATVTKAGMEQTSIGVLAFLGGVILARSVPARFSAAGRQLPPVTSKSLASLDRLALRYLLVGAIVSLVLMPIIGVIPSATAIVSPLGSLIIVGICLRLWVAAESRNSLKFCLTMIFLPVLPLVTVLLKGFIGYGTYWVLAILAFTFAQSKRRWAYVLLAPAVFFCGLSLFVNYFNARDNLRKLVWYDQASLSDRFQGVVAIFDNFEWIDLSNFEHRELLGGRLNQNLLTGAAIEKLELQQIDYAYGATLGNMIIGLVPRALWPDKPQVGGGGTVVHDYTGITFAEGTSVGAGQVLEFYINFGVIGVIGGFFLYGYLLGRIDLATITYLHLGDQKRFLFWFLIGLALLQPGGNLLEIFVAAVASAIAARGTGHFLTRYSRSPEIGSFFAASSK